MIAWQRRKARIMRGDAEDTGDEDEDCDALAGAALVGLGHGVAISWEGESG